MPALSSQPTLGRYLYIAKAKKKGGGLTFKAGKSRDSLRTRERSLRGQSETDYEMLRTFPTLDETLAENLAFEEFDANGWRKFPGTRREQFIGCTMEQLEAVMKRACKVADKDYALTGKAALEQPLTQPKPDRIVGHNPLTRQLLSVLVPYQGSRVTLGHYMSLALDDSRMFRQLERWGLRYRATTLRTLDMQVAWQHPSEIMTWLRTSGARIPDSPSTAIQFKIAAYAKS